MVNNPEETLESLYEFVGEEYYEHTFDNLKNQNQEQDLRTYGLADMHQVHSKLESTAPDPKEILSKNILNKCKEMDFWRQKLNIVQ